MLIEQREIPINDADITPANFSDVLSTILRHSHVPARRAKLYRVYQDGRPLWLASNRTVFRTRPSARAAVTRWFYTCCVSAVGHGWHALDNRLRLNRQEQTAYGLLEAYVEGQFTSGALEIRAFNMPESNGQTEGIAT